jgi:hypothetical protein
LEERPSQKLKRGFLQAAAKVSAKMPFPTMESTRNTAA